MSTKKSICINGWKEKICLVCMWKSEKQPFCDGSHKGSEFSPIIVDNEKEGNIAWCGCKSTGNSPYCDGTHSKL